MTELDEATLARWLTALRGADVILWVEPGHRAAAERLVTVRETLLDDFLPISPCTHDGSCPLSGAAASGRDWCHQFATPAPEAFTDSHWRRFSDTFSVDMRSLPMSHLVLMRRGLTQASPADPAQSRILGRPRIEKGRAFLDLCSSSGYRTVDMLQRTNKPLFKALDRGKLLNPRVQVAIDEERITSIVSTDPDAMRT